MPRWLRKRGHRLAFSNGILLLAGIALALIIATGAHVDKLVAFYAIGVFTGFTLAGFGMAKYYRTHPSTHHRWHIGVNAVAGSVSAVVVVVFAITKFTEGAWLVVIVFPLLVVALLRLHRAYVREEAVLATTTDGLPGASAASTSSSSSSTMSTSRSCGRCVMPEVCDPNNCTACTSASTRHTRPICRSTGTPRTAPTSPSKSSTVPTGGWTVQPSRSPANSCVRTPRTGDGAPAAPGIRHARHAIPARPHGRPDRARGVAGAGRGRDDRAF